MRVLLTGGAGFIGRPVHDRLQAAGHDVVLFDRAVDRCDDIVDRDQVARAVRGCDRVVHLAAKVGLGVDLGDLDAYVRDNDLGTAVVLRSAAEAGIERVVYASSMVVYGEGRYDCPDHGLTAAPPRTREDLKAGRFEVRCPRCGADLEPGLVAEDAPIDPRNVYAATKAHGEQLGSCWARETGGTVAALRFHNVYGPGMPRNTPYAGVAALFADRLRGGEAPLVFEDGGQRRNFVHVADVARAVVAALDASLEPGLTAVNIGTPWVTTVGGVAALLSKALAGPPPVVTGGFRLGDVRHITADCSAAEQILGWRAEIDLAHGLADL